MRLDAGRAFASSYRRSAATAGPSDLCGASWSLDSVRTAPKSKTRPPTSIIPGDDAHRWRDGAAAPRDAAIAPSPGVAAGRARGRVLLPSTFLSLSPWASAARHAFKFLCRTKAWSSSFRRRVRWLLPSCCGCASIAAGVRLVEQAWLRGPLGRFWAVWRSGGVARAWAACSASLQSALKPVLHADDPRTELVAPWPTGPLRRRIHCASGALANHATSASSCGPAPQQQQQRHHGSECGEARNRQHRRGRPSSAP